MSPKPAREDRRAQRETRRIAAAISADERCRLIQIAYDELRAALPREQAQQIITAILTRVEREFR